MNEQRNLNNECDRGFQALLYYRFIVSNEQDVALVSDKMKISSDTLYRYVRGALPFPIDRLPDLVTATGDIGFLEYFAKKCDYTLIPKIKDRREAEIMRHTAEVMMAATGICATHFLRKKK